MLKAQAIDQMSQYIPILRQGHSGNSPRARCRRGCDAELRRALEAGRDEEKALNAYLGRHFLNGDKRWKMAETFLKTGKWPERARKDEAREDEEHLSAERWGFREQGVIHSFNVGDIIQIEVPFMAQKHGALKEHENQILHGAMRQVLPTPPNASRYERLVTVKIGKDKTVGIPNVWCHLVKPAASA